MERGARCTSCLCLRFYYLFLFVYGSFWYSINYGLPYLHPCPFFMSLSCFSLSFVSVIWSWWWRSLSPCLFDLFSKGCTFLDVRPNFELTKITPRPFVSVCNGQSFRFQSKVYCWQIPCENTTHLGMAGQVQKIQTKHIYSSQIYMSQGNIRTTATKCDSSQPVWCTS